MLCYPVHTISWITFTRGAQRGCVKDIDVCEDATSTYQLIDYWLLAIVFFRYKYLPTYFCCFFRKKSFKPVLRKILVYEKTLKHNSTYLSFCVFMWFLHESCHGDGSAMSLDESTELITVPYTGF